MLIKMDLDNDYKNILNYISQEILEKWEKSKKIDISEKIKCRCDGTKLEWDVEVEDGEDDTRGILLHIIRDELELVLNDNLVLSMVACDLEKMCKEECSEDCQKRFARLLGNFTDKNWYVEKYRQKVLEMCKLPDVELLIQVSAQEYEKRFNKSTLRFMDKSSFDAGHELTITFASDQKLLFDAKNLRTVKKYMELAGKDKCLIISRDETDNAYEFSMIGVDEIRDITDESVYIEITSKLSWSVYRMTNKDREILLQYKEGIFHIPFLKPKDELDVQLQKLNDYLMPKDAEAVSEVIKTCYTKASHGTGLIFIGEKEDSKSGSYLEEEINRFTGVYRARKIEPKPMKEIESAGVTEIDGAVFLDLQGRCHAVGVIVDGIAQKCGNPGRGARFNSLYTYGASLADKKDKIYSVVAIISEDEMVDVFTAEDY